MAYDERVSTPALAHNIILEGREYLAVSGVSDVGSYDDNLIRMSTSRGDMTIRGSGLHIEKLTLDTGDLIVRGLISELIYEEPSESGGFWARLFK